MPGDSSWRCASKPTIQGDPLQTWLAKYPDLLAGDQRSAVPLLNWQASTITLLTIATRRSRPALDGSEMGAEMRRQVLPGEARGREKSRAASPDLCKRSGDAALGASVLSSHRSAQAL